MSTKYCVTKSTTKIPKKTRYHQIKTFSRKTYQKSGIPLGKTTDSKDITDVPIVQEDDQKIPAHNIVLALPNGVSEIDPKYHHLVGKNILKYPAEPNGSCQNTSKAASLFSDPRKGKDIAEEKNKYLLLHFEHFEPGYEWRHTIQTGGGTSKTFETTSKYR